MINDTFELRKQYGKMSQIDSSCVTSYEHVSACQACSSKRPERLYSVSGGGWSGMVGSTCLGILTSTRNPVVDNLLIGTGETYQDGDKTTVYPTLEWIKSIGDYIFTVSAQRNRYGESWISDYDHDYGGAYHTSNYSDFLYSVYTQARKHGKVSLKQYNAVNNEILSTHHTKG